jgi:hypothetical protein
MNRTLRNGLAVAGMAGGMLFLGQAVASADQDATATVDNYQSGSNATDGGDSASGNFNAAENDASASNYQKTEVDTTVIGGDAGDNNLTINNGIDNNYVGSSGPAAKAPSSAGATHVDATTGDIDVTQVNQGGDANSVVNVEGSNGDQTATATVENTQVGSNETDGDKHSDSESGNANVADNDADASNVDVTEVDTVVIGGDAGDNNLDIDNSISGNTFKCPSGATCYYNFTTGDIRVVQENRGGDANSVVNVGGDGSYGHPHSDHHKPGHHHDADCPEHKAAPVHHAKPAAPVHHRAAAPMNTYAQPKGELAYTGAETTAPLALGLIALGAGGALTLAGRLHTSTPAVRSAPLAHHPLISASLPTQRWRAHSRRTRTR